MGFGGVKGRLSNVGSSVKSFDARDRLVFDSSLVRDSYKFEDNIFKEARLI